MSAAPWFVLFALLVAERLGELVLSRHNLARGGGDGGQAGDGWRIMIALHVAFFVLPLIEVVLRGHVAPAAVFWPCVLLLTIAQILRWASIGALGPAWNARGIVQAHTPVVSAGLYRWIRHPNYLGVALEFLAFPAAGGAWVAWLVLNPLHALLLRRRIANEEARLSRLPGYTETMASKGALLPRLRAHR